MRGFFRPARNGINTKKHIAMNIEFSKADEVNGLITIVATQEDFKAEIAKQMKEVARTRQEPGFRPGHAPKSLIEKKYGKAVRYDVIDKRISHELLNFISKEELRVLGNPIPNPDNLPNLDDEEMVFSFKVGLAPDIKINVEDIEIPHYTIEVTDDMMERQDNQLCRRFGTQKKGDTVDGTSLVKGVITQLDADGNPVTDGIKVENGIVAPEHFTSEAQKELFMGKNLGAAVVFNPWETCNGSSVEVSSMLHISKEEAENMKDNFQMDITEIIVLRRAEHGEEFYDQVFGKGKVTNEEEYKAAIKDMVARQLASDCDYRFNIDAREALIKAAGDFQLPDAILKDYLKSENEGLTDETIDEEYDRLVPGLRWQLISDCVARDLDLKLNEEDLLNVARIACINQFAQYGMPSVPEDMLQKYSAEMLKDQKVREKLATQAVEIKLFNSIKAKAKLDEKTVTVEEFNKLFIPAEA